MREQDFEPFVALLTDVAALLAPNAPPMSATQRAMYFRAMAGFSLDQVRAALDAHAADPDRGRFMPKPADLHEQLRRADGRPGPEESWAIALQALDEAETVVWTPEIRQAWAAARLLALDGDTIGARMAFKEVYPRLVDEARGRGEPVSWEVTEGHDTKRRAQAVAHAVQTGRLALPAPGDSHSPAHADVLALAAPDADGGLLRLTCSTQIPTDARAALRALGERLRQGPADRDAARERQIMQERQAVADWKQETAARVQTYEAGGATR